MHAITVSTFVALGLNGAVLAQSAPIAIPTPTHDWGCEVLLCLANPKFDKPLTSLSLCHRHLA
jgi:hypothetical protein